MTAVFRHGALRLYLLKLLADRPRHGYEIISSLEDRFFGLYAPSAGTVYPRLSRLEAEGLVEHEELDGRKVYRLTDAGRAELDRQSDALESLEADLSRSVAELAKDVRSQVRASVRDLRDELKQAARDARRESRSHARQRMASPHYADLVTELDELRMELRRTLVDATEPAIAEARETLREMRRTLLDTLAEHVLAHDEDDD
jgi:DNA-binding PadR family transcriptional regulator